ncbi:MAG: diguanylate cyclase [Geminicoccaceae bacterium]|nr:diguanylate cyclase [Geminicoccaceae bacterium]MCB9944212.1 diguanylate cyclase [Geminicoccaceae bacterium]
MLEFLHALGQKGSLARRLSVMNAGIITLLTMFVVVVHLTVYQEMVLERSEQRALHLAGTVADFSASYLLDLRVNDLNVVLHNMRKTGEAERAFVVDAEGTILADGSLDGENILTTSYDDIVAEVLATNAPVSRIDDQFLEVGFPVRLSSTETGVVRLAVSMSGAVAEAGEARGSTILIAGLVLLLSLPLSLMLIRKMTGPLLTLTEHTKAVAAGDLTTKVSIDGLGELGELASSFNRMLDALHEKTERIHTMAYTDALTGLANRARLNDVLYDRVPLATSKQPLVIMLLDLDRFKQVNDTLGHEAGDLLLTLVARRLENVLDDVGSTVRHAGETPRSMLARLGGDEFVCVVDGEGSVEMAREAGKRIVETIGQTFDLSGRTAQIGTSIGIAWAPQAGATASEILRQADLAMYRAKLNGRNCVMTHQLEDSANS